MSLYKYIREVWKKPKQELGDLWKERLIKWRKQPSIVRLEKPTRLDRARSLGYKAKPGIFVVRIRVKRGGHRQPHIMGKGRRSKKYRARMDLDKSYQVVSEQRVAKKYENNCEVLNSYWVAKDGKFNWYEVILLDKSHPVIKKDPKLNWVTNPANKARAQRGKTSAARKSRGIRTKTQETKKLRPSRRAAIKRKNRMQSRRKQSKRKS